MENCDDKWRHHHLLLGGYWKKRLSLSLSLQRNRERRKRKWTNNNNNISKKVKCFFHCTAEEGLHYFLAFARAQKGPYFLTFLWWECVWNFENSRWLQVVWRSITSSIWGEGEVPPSTYSFYSSLRPTVAPRLNQVGTILLILFLNDNVKTGCTKYAN